MDNKEYKQEVLDDVSLWHGFKNFNDLKKSLLQGDGRIKNDYQLDDLIKEAMGNYLETYFKNEFNKHYEDSDDHLID